MVAPTPAAPMSNACAHRAEHHLVELVGVGEELVVVDLDDERDAVGETAGSPRRAPRTSIATALQPPSMASSTMLRGIEVDRVRRERRAGRVLDALVDGQDRDIARCRPGGRGRRATRGCAAPAAGGRCAPTPDRGSRGPGSVSVSFGTPWPCVRAGSRPRRRAGSEYPRGLLVAEGMVARAYSTALVRHAGRTGGAFPRRAPRRLADTYAAVTLNASLLLLRPIRRTPPTTTISNSETQTAATNSIPVIHVFVALADNVNQGIVSVSASLGNGDNPASNLYWGAAFGIKTSSRRRTKIGS